MKNLLVLLLSLGLVVSGCAAKTFTSLTPQASTDDSDNTFDDDDVNPPVDDDDTTVACPRYDLVVESCDTTSVSRNYKFVFNSEMKQTTTQGNIGITFYKDSSTVHYKQCSGTTNNTTILPSFKPLDATEALTKQIVIYPGRSCTAEMLQKQQTIRVIDSANGQVLFNESEFRASLGDCAFGYTAEGEALRQQIVQFAHGVVDQKAASCNN